MTDQEMLTAMTTLLKPIQEKLKPIQEKLESLEQEMTTKEEMTAYKEDILNGVKILLENVVESEIKLVAENVQLGREEQVSAARVETLEGDVDVLKTVVRTHSREINELKRA